MNGNWRVVWTKQAMKERDKAIQAGFRDKLKMLVSTISENPFSPYPPYEQLIGDFAGMFSRRINRQHRLIYMVYEDMRTVKILSCWSHYESL